MRMDINAGGGRRGVGERSRMRMGTEAGLGIGLGSEVGPDEVPFGRRAMLAGRSFRGGKCDGMFFFYFNI